MFKATKVGDTIFVVDGRRKEYYARRVRSEGGNLSDHIERFSETYVVTAVGRKYLTVQQEGFSWKFKIDKETGHVKDGGGRAYENADRYYESMKRDELWNRIHRHVGRTYHVDIPEKDLLQIAQLLGMEED